MTMKILQKTLLAVTIWMAPLTLVNQAPAQAAPFTNGFFAGKGKGKPVPTPTPRPKPTPGPPTSDGER